jgi:hypothetical protein
VLLTFLESTYTATALVANSSIGIFAEDRSVSYYTMIGIRGEKEVTKFLVGQAKNSGVSSIPKDQRTRAIEYNLSIQVTCVGRIRDGVSGGSGETKRRHPTRVRLSGVCRIGVGFWGR